MKKIIIIFLIIVVSLMSIPQVIQEVIFRGFKEDLHQALNEMDVDDVTHITLFPRDPTIHLSIERDEHIQEYVKDLQQMDIRRVILPKKESDYNSRYHSVGLYTSFTFNYLGEDHIKISDKHGRTFVTKIVNDHHPLQIIEEHNLEWEKREPE